MRSNDRPEEDLEHSCRTIAKFITMYEGDDEKSHTIRETLLKDLCWKLSRIDPASRAAIVGESWYYFLPPKVKELFSQESLGLRDLAIFSNPPRQDKNVGIVTVIQPELKAVLHSLGVDPDKPNRQSKEFSYWFADVVGVDETPLSVVVTMIGKPRNVPCAIAVAELLNQFALQLVIMIGIAAGPKKHVKLGDVICGERVYDYEHFRLELQKSTRRKLPKPEYAEIFWEVRNHLARYDEQWMIDKFKTIIEFVDSENLPRAPEKIHPRFHKATIAAGEKLFADGKSIMEMCNVADQRIRAVDQEDSGFAQVCGFKNIPWCVFRGICDYGDPAKGDDWQFVSALAAAAAAIAFLERGYRPVVTGT